MKARTRAARVLAIPAVAALALGLTGLAGGSHPPSASAAPATDVVVTTTHDSYTETGTWAEARDPGYEGGRTRYTREAGATASWTVVAPADGEYTIDAWYTASVDNDKQRRHDDGFDAHLDRFGPGIGGVPCAGRRAGGR